MSDTPPLSGRRVLVMGAAGEVASAVVLGLATAGADVALTTTTSDADEAFGLRRISRQIEALGRRCVVESVDMSLGTNVQIAVRQVAKQLGGIDILVAAPGFRLDRASDRLSDAEWARVLGLNFSAVFYACRSVSREMARQEGTGRIIVLLPSTAETDPAAYVAARAGAQALVQALAQEWIDRPLTLNPVILEGEASAVANAATAAVLSIASGTSSLASGELVVIR